YPAVADGGNNPLEHFLRCGMRRCLQSLPSDLPDLEDRIERVLRDDPDNLYILRVLIPIRFQQGRYEDVVSTVGRIDPVDVSPGETLFLLLAQNSLSWRKYDLALCVEIYHEILKLTPTDVFARNHRGRLLRMLGRHKEAAEELERAAKAGGAGSPEARDYVEFAKEISLAEDLEAQALKALAVGDAIGAHRLVREAEVLRPGAQARVFGAQSCPQGKGNAGLLLIDSSFPSPVSSFRYGEFSSYLEAIPDSRIYSSLWEVSPYGSGENFLESTLRYSKKSGVDISRVQSFDANRDMTCRLAYCVF
ncbi:hypothetical protein GTA51_20360, partial [Desulfovibrio aerotolerans]